jgi:hypothetical protein
MRSRSCACLGLSANSFEDRFDFNFQHGGIGLAASLVGGHCMRAAKDDVGLRSGGGAAATAIRAVARGIGRTEESDRRCSKSDGEMQRPGVSADDTKRVAQESHQWAKVPIVEERIGGAAGIADRGGESFFPGAIIDDAAQAKRISDFFT